MTPRSVQEYAAALWPRYRSSTRSQKPPDVSRRTARKGLGEHDHGRKGGDAMRLDPGDRFPTVSAPTVEHGDLTLPDDLQHEWNVILYYRGHF